MFLNLFRKFLGRNPKKAIKKDTAIRLICAYAELTSEQAEGAYEALDSIGLIDHSRESA